MDTRHESPTVLWRQVWGLTAIRGAIVLLWVVYQLYLPELLLQFGWSKGFALQLLIVESAIAAVLEPLMGKLSDQQQHWMGTRLPLILLGVTVTSAITISLPAIAIFGASSRVLHWGIIAILIAWAIAMTLFNSPTLALLSRYAAVPRLPIAVALLILFNGLLRATKPLVHDAIVTLGPAVTLAASSFILLGATAILRSLEASLPAQPERVSLPPANPLPWATLGLFAGVGLAVDLALRLVTSNTSKLLHLHWQAIAPQWLEWSIGLGIALMAIPAGILAVRWGIQAVLCAALIAIAGFSVLMAIFPNPSLLLLSALGLVVALSFLLNGGICLVLSSVPIEQAGVATGMYLGGTSASFSLMGLVFSQVPLHLNIFAAATTCLIGLLWVVASRQPHPTPWFLLGIGLFVNPLLFTILPSFY